MNRTKQHFLWHFQVALFARRMLPIWLLPIAWGFANWPALGWLAAAVIPVVIHLLSRRRFHEEKWAAVRFLLAALKRTRRRLRLEQILLLLLRSGVLVLVALAAADPFVEKGPLSAAGTVATHRMLVIDGSFSMAFQPADESCFDRAKQIAQQIVQACPEGDAFTVLLMCKVPQLVVARPLQDRQQLLSILRQLELPHWGPNATASLQEVLNNLRRIGQQYPHFARHHVYFISDLQRQAWAPEFHGGDIRQLRQLTQQIGRLASVSIVDVGFPYASNRAVVSLVPSEPIALVGKRFSVTATIANFAPQAVTNFPVALIADGYEVGRRLVELPAWGQTTVSFNHTFSTPGDHWLEVRLPQDRLQLDDRRYLAVSVKPWLRVLCVDGRPHPERFRSATGYLVAALEPDPQKRQRQIDITVVPAGTWSELSLKQYDCIFFCDVPLFAPAESALLANYLKQGGGAVFFLGPRVQARLYNRELARGDDPTQWILPARIGSFVNKPQFEVNPLEYRHPIVAVFRGHEDSGLLTIPVAQHYKLEVPEEGSTRIVLKLGDGSPLVVEKPYGNGQVVLFATSSDSVWTSLPKWPSFVPLVHETLKYCLRNAFAPRNLEIGRPIGGSIPGVLPQLNVQVQLPSGETQAATVEVLGNETRWLFEPKPLCGLYRVTFGNSAISPQWFAQNPEPAESDLLRISPNELRFRLWRGVDIRIENGQQLSTTAGPVRPQTNPLAKLLLYAAVFVLIWETFLAWRFAHGV